MACFLLAVFNVKREREREREREERQIEVQTVISKKEPVLDDLENSQPIQTAKDEKVCSVENTKVVTGPHFVEKLGM